MFNTFLITLREGLEASLIVGILFAYIAKTGQRRARGAIWIGVGSALLLSLGFGAFLTFTSNSLTESAEELFAGVTSLTAVALVTWMVFWMQRTARFLSSELHSKLDQAMAIGTMGLISTAFLAVIREGLETSLFLYASFKTMRTTITPLLGLVAGLGAALVLGYLIYRRSISINLSKFFTITGVGLVLVAASVLRMGIVDITAFLGLHIPDAASWLLALAYCGITLKFYLPSSTHSKSTPAAASRAS